VVAASRLEARRRRAAWLFVMPAVLALAAVAGWPLLRTVYLGLTDAVLGVPDHRVIGLANLSAIAADPDWWRAVRNTLAFAAASVTLETALGLGIALVLHAHLPGRGLLRAAILVPWAIPTVVSAQMWAWMYHDLYGVVNHLLMATGIVDAPRAWTAEPGLALAAVVAVDVWKTTPFVALLALAALTLVPRDLYEAARVDGVPAHTVFRRVTLPLVWPALGVAVLFRLLDALRIFDLVYVLTGDSRHTASMSVYVRQQLVDFGDVGYGSAAATWLVLVVGAVAALYLTAARVRPGGGAA
jgi:trehalose/maltose transport system permease protein